MADGRASDTRVRIRQVGQDPQLGRDSGGSPSSVAPHHTREREARGDPGIPRFGGASRGSGMRGRGSRCLRRQSRGVVGRQASTAGLSEKSRSLSLGRPTQSLHDYAHEMREYPLMEAQATHRQRLVVANGYSIAARRSLQACSQARQASAQMRQCSWWSACASHSSPQDLQACAQAWSCARVRLAS